MHGIELIKNIRKFDDYFDYFNGKTKFILLSAFIKEDLIYNNQEVLDRKLIDNVLEKPLSLAKLKAGIIEVLNNL